MSGIPIQGFGGVVAEVDAQRNLQTKLPDASVPANVGGVRIFSENDAGDYTGTPDLLSPETDDDYRFRASLDTILDSETFNYTAQNTGKHIYSNTTMTTTWTAGQMTTNGSSITTTTTAVNVSTKAFFPLFGAAPLYAETTLAFTAAATTNTYIRFGMFLNGGGTAYTPTDGAFFELGPSGLNCYIVNNSGTPVAATIATPFTHTNNTRHKFTITITERLVSFWIDDVLYGTIACPVAQGQPFMAAALPWAISHTIIGGAAGSVIQALVADYTISIGGYNLAAPPELTMNAMFGSYQGLSGGTMGSLASYANSANPTAAVPTNTTSTILTALGGQGWETDTLAVTTDGIIMSYQVPAGTVNVLGKRLVVYGVRISSFIQTALTGGGYNAQFCLAFGHTAVSLATAEAATTKAPRRVALDSYSVVAAAAVLAQLPLIDVKFKCPIVVNPGEFIAIVKKKVGTAPSAGVVAYTFLLDYHWL